MATSATSTRFTPSAKQVDVLTIEIENVNLEALFKLEEEGLDDLPSPTGVEDYKRQRVAKTVLPRASHSHMPSFSY
jgi:phosphoribosylaminoimidazole carboxylase (NCAIR synthetase)